MKNIELEEIEKELISSEVNPRKDWQDRTLSNLQKLSDLNVTKNLGTRKRSRNIILNFTSILMTGSKKTLLTGVSSALVVSFGVVGGLLFLNSNKQVKKEKLNLTAEQQAEIFQNIAKQNSQIINTRISSGNSIASTVAPALAANQEKNIEDTTSSADIASSSKLMAPALPYMPDYTYSYSTTTSKTGPAVEQCAAMNLDSLYTGFSNSISESYTYNDSSTGSYYSKYLTKSESNEIISYYLSESHSSRSESLEFLGGKYAAKTISTFPTIANDPVASIGFVEPLAPEELIAPADGTMPSDQNVDYSSLIQSLYGPDAKITEKVVDEEGKEYYIIEYSYGMNCDEENMIFRSSIAPVGDDYTDTIVVQDWVSLENFNIGKTQMYLGSSEDSNLIMDTSTISEYSNTSFESVASNFEFEFDVEVKEKLYDYSQDTYTYNPQAEADKVFTSLGKLNTNVIFVEEPKYETSSIYVTDINPSELVEEQDTFYDYLTDRDFYSSSDLGQLMYDNAVKWNNYDYNYPNDFAMSIVNLSQFVNKETYQLINIDAFDANKDSLEKIKKTYISEDFAQNLTESTVQITIDNTAVNATLYSFEEGAIVKYAADGVSTLEDFTSLSITDPIPPEGESVTPIIKTQIIMFNYKGANYTIRLPFANFDLSTIKFKSYNTQNSSDMNFLKEQINYALVTLYEQQSSSTSGASEPALY